MASTISYGFNLDLEQYAIFDYRYIIEMFHLWRKLWRKPRYVNASFDAEVAVAPVSESDERSIARRQTGLDREQEILARPACQGEHHTKRAITLLV